MNEVLRLATTPTAVIPVDIETTAMLAAELRRLHALNAELVEALRCCRDMVAHPDNLEFIDAALAKCEVSNG